MARNSNSAVLAVTIAVVLLVLLAIVTGIASDSSTLGSMPAVAVLPAWLKFCGSLVGAAIAISVLVHFALRIYRACEVGVTDMATWMIAFLAALAIWETYWATLLALTAVIVTHLILAFLSQRTSTLPRESAPPLEE